MSTQTKKDQAQDNLNRAKDSVSQAGEKAKEGASGAFDHIKDAASQVGQAASSAASAAGQTVGNVASNIGHKADDATAAAGRGIESLGEKVRQKGPESGFLGSATRTVANALESSGEYLEQKKLSGMAEDLTDLVRNNPIPALLVGIGLGFLLGRALRS